MQKATLKDLIARQAAKEKSKHETYEIFVKSMEKALVFKRPSDELRLDMIDEMGKNPKMREVIALYKKMIYLSCELLQNTELHEQLGVIDPLDTVDAIFDLDDITDIGEKLMDAMGVNEVEEDIKNS